MFKIFPIQDKARQNELCIESGITYREDLPELKEAIGGYINAGLYEGI